jgi:heavy metal sensor kinase
MKDSISLRARLVLWMAALEALLLVVLAVVFSVSLHNIQNREINETLRLSAAQLNEAVDVRDGRYDIPQQDTTALRERSISAWILTPQGDVGATVGDVDATSLPHERPTLGSYLDTALSDGGSVRLYVSPLTEGQENLGTMVLALSLSQSRALLRQVLISLGVAIPVVLLVSASGGLFLSGRALSPVAAITDTVRQISAADLSQRLQIAFADDEIGRLARTFNAMLDRLDNAFKRERQFTADASHELRTPLGMLKTQLSLARSRPRSAAELLQMMSDMEGDVDRMTRLIEQMLTLARIEQRGVAALASVDLRDMLRQVTRELQMRAQEQQIELSLVLPSEVCLQMHGDAEQLRQVFTNLIENGLKHTPPGGQVTVSAERHWQTISVTVADTGEGIAAQHLPHVFERFYRADDARTRDHGGFGLGLAITQAIVHAHGGQIAVTSVPTEGTSFVVTFVDPSASDSAHQASP